MGLVRLAPGLRSAPVQSPHALVITATAPGLWMVVWGFAGPWWATGDQRGSLAVRVKGKSSTVWTQVALVSVPANAGDANS